MRTTRLIAQDPDFTVRTVVCQEHAGGWSVEEPVEAHQIVLVRSGAFQVRTRGVVSAADTVTGYWQTPGHEQQFAHPHDGGDVCTSITLSPRLWHETECAASADADRVLHVDGRTNLHHRLLLRTSVAADPAFGAAEQLVGLLTASVARTTSPSRTTAASRRLVDAARQALAGSDPAASGLIPLARALGTSPSHLSRCFRRDVGVSITRYRIRVRISRALARIEDGERDLAALAADLGFADQAHLTRAAHAETGHTPARLRALLAA